MYFPSKKDIWLTVIIWLFAFFFIIPPIFFPHFGVWMTPEFFDKQWIKIIILSPIGLFLLWFWFQTGYTIADNLLIIRYGPFKKNIQIDEIHSLRETKNPFSAPALSMDKLELSFTKFDMVAISPKNKNEFVQQLLKQNPRIKIDKDFQTRKEN